VRFGARQIECTINGIGERAGNCALEEIVMAVKTRPAYYHLTTGVETREIARTSRLVSALTGMSVQPNKAVVGANAFAHASGVHQDGMIKNPLTYEILKPEDVGVEESKLLLTARSGRMALGKRLAQLGYPIQNEVLREVFERFKTLADKKRYVYDDDLHSLMDEAERTSSEHFTLQRLHYASGTHLESTATVCLLIENVEGEEAATGDGPVAAVFRAIDRVTGLAPALLHYQLQALPGGQEAQGEVTVQIEDGGSTFLGKGVSTDVVEASAKAYVHALNRLWQSRPKTAGA
jgi:2-isopropylmalate synthase